MKKIFFSCMSAWTAWLAGFAGLLRALGIAGLVGCVASGAVAQIVAQPMEDKSAEATWRASSRLGYGPHPAMLMEAFGGARAWSLVQIEAAYAASQRPAQVPPAFQAIVADANAVTRRFHKEREDRRLGRLNQATQASLPIGLAGSTSETAPMTLAALIDAGDPENYSRIMAQSAVGWRLSSCSQPELEHPVLARMTEFWFNHFNVFLDKGTVRPFVGSYLLTAIRPHALGKFEDLLLATAQHPAMLMYLDQAQSNARGLNENYARELLELHTLGVNGGYTQDDVRALAHILTGWSVDIAGGRAFVFRPRAHEARPQSLLGQTFNANGQQQGIEAIKFLARHPATASRIAARVATFFVADKPPQSLINRLQKNFLDTGGDLRSMMQTLVQSPEFWDTKHQLIKTPQDFACSALLAAGAITDERLAVQSFRQTLGF
ncbi:MAG: DUF1800 domain-containing protein [Brachymonas sp.]|nr:DUF1800 domain-containing protein [Brachymonas sp.]